jgi:phosphoglycerate kinase
MGILDGIRSIEELSLDGQRLFLRLDADLAPAQETGLSSERLSRALPSIEHAVKAGARVVLASRMAEPKDKRGSVTLEPLAERLSERLKTEIFLPDSCIGDAARKVIQDLRPGQICLLENLGAFAEEEQNEDAFARLLARFAEVYVNDALADSEHSLASLETLPRLVRERGMSLGMAAELRALARFAEPTEAPFVLVLGGGGALERLDLLEALLERVSAVLVAGTLGNTLLAARGYDLKESRFDRSLLARGRALLTRARDRKVEVMLPVDLVVGESTGATSGQIAPAASIPADSVALDIGPKTLELYGARVAKAKSALWCGTFGAPKNPAFGSNILEFSRHFAVADSDRVRVVIGEDTRAALLAVPLEIKSTIGFISTGGRASLELIKRRRLPGVEALRSGAP